MTELLFLIIGIIVGSSTGLFFFRNEKQWLKYLSLTGGNGSLLASFWYILSKFGIPINQSIYLALIYLSSAFIAFIIVVGLLIHVLKNDTKDDEFKFRTLDILLGYKDAIKQYYETRKKYVDEKLNIKKLTEKQKTITYEQKNLKTQKERLEKVKRETQDLIQKSVCIDLPLDARIPVNDGFITAIPVFTENLTNYCTQLALFTEEFKTSTEILKKDSYTSILAYMMAVCSFTAIHLFDSNTVRVHLRFLNIEGDHYEKFAASVGKEKVLAQMTPIPIGHGMIFEATKARRSLIKSLNQEHHIVGAHDHIWEDYITIVFDDESLCYNGKPIMTMGVSVRNEDQYKYLMRFLNHCHVERLIQKHLVAANEKLDFMGFITEGGTKWQKSA